jgi:hypothetical protein
LRDTTPAPQEERFMRSYTHGSDLIPPEEVAGGITNAMARRWVELSQLQVLLRGGACAHSLQ